MAEEVVKGDGWLKPFMGLHRGLGVRRDDLCGHLGDELRALLKITDELQDHPSVVYDRVAAWIERMILDFKPKRKTSKAVLLSLRVSYNVDIDDHAFNAIDFRKQKPISKLDLKSRQERLGGLEYGKCRVGHSTSREYVSQFQAHFLSDIEAELRAAGIIPSVLLSCQ